MLTSEMPGAIQPGDNVCYDMEQEGVVTKLGTQHPQEGTSPVESRGSMHRHLGTHEHPLLTPPSRSTYK